MDQGSGQQPMAELVPLLLTPEAVKGQLSCSRTTVYDLLAAGELVSVKIGRSRRITYSSVERYVAKLIESQAVA